MAGVAGLVLVLAAAAACWYLLDSRNAELAKMQQEKADIEVVLASLAPDMKHYAAVKEWNDQTVHWRWRNCTT
jgi:hypothetical protein